MKKENLYLIHGEDYLRHIEEKLELLWMATILMHYIKNGAEKDSYLDLVRRSTLDFDERCEEMFSSWGKPLRTAHAGDMAVSKAPRPALRDSGQDLRVIHF